MGKCVLIGHKFLSGKEDLTVTRGIHEQCCDIDKKTPLLGADDVERIFLSRLLKSKTLKGREREL